MNSLVFGSVCGVCGVGGGWVGVSVCVFMRVCVCLFVCFSLWMDLMFVGRNAMCSHYLHIESNISNNDVIMIINSLLWFLI